MPESRLPLNDDGQQRAWQAELERDRLMTLRFLQENDFPGPGAAAAGSMPSSSPSPSPSGPSSSPGAPGASAKPSPGGLPSGGDFNETLTQARQMGGGMDGGATEEKEGEGLASRAVGGAGRAVETAGKGVKTAGKGVETAGKAAEMGGKAAEAGGKAAEAGGKAAKAGGRAVRQGSQAAVKAGAQLSSTGLGAIAGVPLMAIGAAGVGAGAGMEAGGAAAQAGGKAAQAAGKAGQQAGQAAQKAGANVQKVGERMTSVGGQIKNLKGMAGGTGLAPEEWAAHVPKALQRIDQADSDSIKEGLKRLVGPADTAAAAQKAAAVAAQRMAQGDVLGAVMATYETAAAESFRTGVIVPLILASFADYTLLSSLGMNVYYVASKLKLKGTVPLSPVEEVLIWCSNLMWGIVIVLVFLLLAIVICLFSSSCPVGLFDLFSWMTG